MKYEAVLMLCVLVAGLFIGLIIGHGLGLDDAYDGMKISKVIEKECPVCVAQEVECKVPAARIIETDCSLADCYDRILEVEHFKAKLDKLEE